MSIRSFAVVRAVLTYMYWFSILAGSVSTDQQENERKKTDRAERIMTKRLPTQFDYILVTYNAGCAYVRVPCD